MIRSCWSNLSAQHAKMHFRGLVCTLPVWELSFLFRNALPMRDWPFPCLEVRSCESYIQLCAPKVVAMAVRMVMRMLRIFPQVELLLKVPIVLDVWLKVRFVSQMHHDL